MPRSLVSLWQGLLDFEKSLRRRSETQDMILRMLQSWYLVCSALRSINGINKASCDAQPGNRATSSELLPTLRCFIPYSYDQLWPEIPVISTYNL